MHFSIVFLSIFLNLVYCKIPIYIHLSVVLEDNAIHITDKKFFSVALDTSVVADHFKDFDMKNNRLYNLIKLVTPGYLRIGGNMADRLHFSENSTLFESYNFDFAKYIEECANEELENCYYDYPNFTMSGEEWININNFAKKVNTKILFDLNCLIRYENGSWNSENAEDLISFSNARNFDIDWQLGNEPNAFKHVFNYPVNASQLAEDFVVLRKILNKYSQYKNSILVGPDVTRPRPTKPGSEKYLKKFLQTINKNNILNAISFHQYYLNGRIATKSDFLNPEIFDLLKQQINIVNSIVNTTGFSNVPVWLTETSSAYGGGAPGLSDSFVGSFLWLDKLGQSAKSGVKVVVRQSIKRNNYALIDDHYNPNPDWWLSVLFNKFVGSEVLNCSIAAPTSIRLYCHCSPSSQTPTVTIFGINISNFTAFIQVKGMLQNYPESSAYILTAKNDDLLSKKVLLNGKILELSNDGFLPKFLPKYVGANQPLEMPSPSLAFWTIPAPNFKTCHRR